MNLYVRERGFTSLYVRMTSRWIDQKWHNPTLDLANITASRPGNGAFTALIARLRREYPGMTLYVESASAEQFQKKLVRLGFRPIGLDCFAL